MRIRRLAALSAALLTAGLLSAAPTLAGSASAAEGDWQDGTSSSDTIINCPTQTPGIGFSANTGWRSPTGQVPKVGEAFWIRGYIGLISLPCNAEGAGLAIPEIILPAGVSFVDEAVRWALYTAGTPANLTTGGLEYWDGLNGGATITQTGDKPFTVKRGQILEFQLRIRATRELKGTATQAPTCTDRRDGTAPCPRSQSGDHLQFAFNVGGHGGDKYYVTPYVPLFATNAAGGGDTTAPETSLGGPANGAIVPSTSATFTIGSSEAGTVACTLDGRARACSTGAHPVAGLAPGTHTFAAKAKDQAGNTDPTAAVRTWTVPVPARSLTRSTGWSLVGSSSAYGGKVTSTTRLNAALSYSVRGARRLALVASGGTTHGTVRVYAGSRLVKTVSLRTSRTLTRRVIPVASFASAWSGKVKVVVVTSGKPVRIEGIAAPTR